MTKQISEFAPLLELFDLAEEILPLLEEGEMEAAFTLDDYLPPYPNLLGLLLAWANSPANNDVSRHPAYEFLMHKALESLHYAVRQNDDEGLQWLSIVQENTKEALRKKNDLLCRSLIRGCADVDLVLPEELIPQAAEWHFNDHSLMNEQAANSKNVISFPEKPDAMINELLAKLEPDEASQVYDILKPELHYLPAEAVALIAASLLASSEAVVRNTAPLFILHPRLAVRDAIIKALGNEEVLDKVDARGRNRLVTLRHYLPKAQSEQLDKIIKTLNRRNLSQEKTTHGELKLWASAMDGSGATAISSMRKVKTKWQVSGIILKEEVGVVDCWESDPVTKSMANKTLALIREKMPSLVPVNENYLQSLIPHYLYLNKRSGELPEPILLEWLEKLGDGLWQPNRFDFNQWLQEQHLDVSEEEEDRAFTRLTHWFEQEREQLRWWELGEHFNELAEEVFDKFDGNEAINEEAVFEEAFALVREKWTDRFIQLSLWAQCDNSNKIPPWRNFALLAQAIKEGRPASHLPIVPYIVGDSLQAAAETITGFTEDEINGLDWLDDDDDWDDTDPFDTAPHTPDLFDGSTITSAKSHKVGRNDPCPCGSGKKYKKCCGK